MKTFRIALDIYGEYTVYITETGDRIVQTGQYSYELDGLKTEVSHTIECIQLWCENTNQWVILSYWSEELQQTPPKAGLLGN